MSLNVDTSVMSYSRKAAFAPERASVTACQRAMRYARTSIVHRCLRSDRSIAVVETRWQTYHATESLLPRCIPQLEADLEPLQGHLLRHEKRAACGRRVLGVELVLRVASEQAGLAHTCAGRQRARDRARRGAPELPMMTILLSIPCSMRRAWA